MMLWLISALEGMFCQGVKNATFHVVQKLASDVKGGKEIGQDASTTEHTPPIVKDGRVVRGEGQHDDHQAQTTIQPTKKEQINR